MNSFWRRSDSSCSVRMSISQPISCEARRTFWPRRPMASESCSSGTTTSMRSACSSSTTLATSAGCSAETTRSAMVVGPRNDVDLFALQFGDHRLDARAAHTDAGADRIDGGIRSRSRRSWRG